MEILLVEDSSSDAYLLREFFSKNNDAPRIHWVVDGYYALDYLMQRKGYQHVPPPDVILLDLNLPRINGFEILIELKNNISFSKIPVVILTTSRDPLDHTQCAALGADMCLTKPYAVKEFEEMVQRLMQWASMQVATKAANSPPVH